MYTMNQIIFIIIFTLIASGCSSEVILYKRVAGEGLYREELIGEYSYKTNKINTEINFSSANILIKSFENSLPSIITSFENGEYYTPGRSDIERITLSEELDYIRIEMRDCRYFEFEFRKSDHELILRESGVMGPCH